MLYDRLPAAGEAALIAVLLSPAEPSMAQREPFIARHAFLAGAPDFDEAFPLLQSTCPIW